MQLVWSRPLSAVPLGLSMARETGALLVWDGEQHLSRFDRLGQRELRQRAPATLIAATQSDDGLTVAAVGRRGQVWLMTADLVVVFERSLPARPVALAMDPLGQRLAVTDDAGGLYLFERSGEEIWRGSAAKPLVHLAFVPEAPALVASAEFGLVCAFDRDGRCRWRDGLVAHAGGMAVSGDGSRIVLACFTEGLNCYTLAKLKRTQLARAAPSRLVGLDYRGEVLVTTGLANELALRGTVGDVRDVLMLPATALALAVEALGAGVVVALADGSLARVELGGERG